MKTEILAMKDLPDFVSTSLSVIAEGGICMSLRQRWADWRLERRIARLYASINWASVRSGCLSDDYAAYLAIADSYHEIARLESQRSQQQLARMKGRGE